MRAAGVYNRDSATLERAFNILAQADLRACYDSLLKDPSAPALFPYGGLGSVLVAGDRSRDGRTFFATQILAFQPEHRERRFQAPLRSFDFCDDRATSLPSELGAIVALVVQRRPAEAQDREEHIRNLARLLPLVTSETEKAILAQAAMAAAEGDLGFSWARCLGPFAEHIPQDLLRTRWDTFRAGLAELHASSTDWVAPEGVELARLMRHGLRSEVIETVFDAVQAMASPVGGFGIYGKAEALARLLLCLPEARQCAVRRDVLEEASLILDSRQRAAVLHALARGAPDEEKLAILRLAWKAARTLDDGRAVASALGAFSRYLSGEDLNDALAAVADTMQFSEESTALLKDLARRTPNSAKPGTRSILCARSPFSRTWNGQRA